MRFGNAATGYTGAKTVAWSGPGVAPSGTAPVYPPNVSFVDGTGTATVTLFRAETTTLAASEASVTGTSSGIVVRAGPASTMRLANCVVNGSPASACVTGPFEVGGANGYLSASIDLFDAWRNVPAPTPVTVNLHSSDPAKFTAPTSVSVTGAGSPVNRSSALTVTHTANGSDTTTITASAAGFTNLVFTVKK